MRELCSVNISFHYTHGYLTFRLFGAGGLCCFDDFSIFKLRLSRISSVHKGDGINISVIITILLNSTIVFVISLEGISPKQELLSMGNPGSCGQFLV